MTIEELKKIAENEIIMGAHSEGGVDVEDIMSGRELSKEDADQVMALIDSATVSITWDKESPKVGAAPALSEDHPWVVSWTIDSNASSPEEAAAKIWREVFGRDFAGTDDACTFTVTDVESGKSVEIDLSENTSVSVQD
jgi:hypothetical protein